MYSIVEKIINTSGLPLSEIFREKNRCYTYINPVTYLSAVKEKSLFAKFDGLFADGSLLVIAIRLLYGKAVERRSFDMTSMAPELFSYAEKNGKTIYIVASEQEELEKAIEIFGERYPELKFVGCRNGYFSSEEEMDAEAKHICLQNPDYLIVGMGVMAQEKFLIKVKEAGYKGIGFTCGGFIHQTALNGGKTDYYPKIVNKMNIRFLYRMYKEPHTRKRYLKAALVFPLKFAWDRIHN